MGKRTALLLLFAVILIGCTRGTPAAPAGTAKPVAPAPAAPAGGRAEDLVARAALQPGEAGGGGAPVVLQPGVAAVTGIGPQALQFTFARPVDRQALQAYIEVTPPARLEWHTDAQLHVQVPPGDPGEVEVRFRQGAPLPAGGILGEDVRYRLSRREGAQVTFYLGERVLAMPAPGRGAFGVAGVIELRVQLGRPADRASVEAAVLASTKTVAALNPVNMTWENDQVLRLRLGAPTGTFLTLSLAGAKDRENLRYLDTPIQLWWQRESRLWSTEPDGAKPMVLAQFAHSVTAAAASAGGQGVAYVEPTRAGTAERPLGALWLLDVRTGERREVGLAVEAAVAPVWAGGQRLVVAADGGLYMLDLDHLGATVKLAPPTPGWALSPDGRRLAFLADRGSGSLDLVVTGFPSGVTQVKPLGLRLPAVTLPVNVAWRPDGRWLAVLYGSQVTLLEADGDGRRELGVLARGQTRALAWAPGGEHLAAGEQLLALPGGEAVAALPGAAAAFWSPDGTRLLWAGGNQVRTYAVGSGREVSLDEGVPAGWLSTGHTLVLRE